MTERLRVFVLEDDARTRASLIGRLQVAADIEVVGEAGTLTEASSALSALEVDVLLFDLQLPDGNAVALIAEQQQARPNTPVLVISVFGDEERVIGAIEAGARGYLLKDDTGEDIADAVRRSVQGESPISPAIARHLIRRFQQPAPVPDACIDNPLSERELEVLKLAAKGLTYQETAQLLAVSVNTIGTYTRRVYQKLAVTSRAQAIFEAQQMGLMDDRQ
ncbi:MAG: response regulator transcription factor [Pseudomonadota bacterium]